MSRAVAGATKASSQSAGLHKAATTSTSRRVSSGAADRRGSDLRQRALGRQPADPAPLRAKRQDVAVLQQSLGHDLAVDRGAMPG